MCRPRATSRRCSGPTTTCVRASPHLGPATAASCRTWTISERSTVSTCARCSRGSVIPIHVHGEGLCVRGTAESFVTWDYEMFASEDLVFGHMAVVQRDDLGVRVGLRGDHVSVHVEGLPEATTTVALGEHPRRPARPATDDRASCWSVCTPTGSSRSSCPPIGIVMALTGALHFPPEIMPLLVVSMAFWFAMFALSGAINSGGGASPRDPTGQGRGRRRSFSRS